MLRTIPDNENEGCYRVVVKTEEGYDTLKGGFETRIDADAWQKELTSGAESLCELDRGEYSQISR